MSETWTNVEVDDYSDVPVDRTDSLDYIAKALNDISRTLLAMYHLQVKVAAMANESKRRKRSKVVKKGRKR